MKREKNIRGLNKVDYKDLNISQVIGKDKKVKPKIKEDNTIY